jgi:hypothetical protein
MAVGALLACVAAFAAVLALRRGSRIGRRLAIIAPDVTRPPRWRSVAEIDLRHAAVPLGMDRVGALRICAALAAAVAGAFAALVVPVGPVAIAAAAYGGFIAPSVWIGSRAAARRREAERAVTALVERTHALVAAGRPPETALAILMARPSGSVLLDAVLRRAADAYALGAPIFRTLAASARDDGLASCAAFADELDRARDLGRGSLAVIRERRDALRASERARAIEAASGVEGKLMLIMVLCYLPALVVLVVIPLFLGLLEGLFA